MKIFFLKKGKSKLGSNRIFIDHYSKIILGLNPQTKVSETIEDGFDVYIVSKYATGNEILNIKKNNPNTIIGVIQPSDISENLLQKIKLSDFLICGSIVEKDYYLKYNKPTFFFPLIEDLKLKKTNNLDNQNSKLKIGYHGNLEHLQGFPSELARALEILSVEYDLELIVVYDQSLGKWNKPKINITEINWSLENMLKHMSQVDIGIVPSLRKKNYKNIGKYFEKIPLINKLYINRKSRNDYVIRFKNTTNAGRAFVFHQLKIPTVSDFSPENFIINGDPKCGYLAHNFEGWYNAIKELADDKNKRKSIAENAYKRFNLIYDLEDYVIQFLDSLKKIYNEKKN